VFKWIKTAKKIFSGIGADRALVRIKDDGFMSDDIAVNIEDIISEEDHDDIGKLHILSMTEFHHALGETWDKREAKIFLLTEGVLRDRVGQGNRWEHQSKEIYIMLFPTLSEVEADARAYDIAEEIGRKIIGDRFDGERRPLMRIAGVDPKDALNDDGSLNIEFLEKAGRAGEAAGNETAKNKKDNLSRMAQAQKNTDPTQQTQKNSPTDIHWKKNHLAQNAENTNWQTAQKKPSSMSEAEWVKLERKRKEAAKDEPQWVAMTKSKPVQDPVIVPPPEKNKPTYSVEYAPCWEKQSQSLRLYRARFCYSAPNIEKLEGQKAYGKASDQQKLKTDLWVLQQTAKALFPFNTQDIVIPVFIPFHSPSLRAINLPRVLEQLKKFTPRLRERFLILEILDDGQWTPEDIQHTCQALKPLCAGVALSLHNQNDFATQLYKELDWVGIDFSNLDAQNGISLSRLEECLHTIHNIQAKPYALGLRRRDQVNDMLEIGMELINGVALVRNTPKLRPPFNLPIERLKKSG
jgi:EAL domain-containing protein (putative c-di-GMP-specific phosphodiesterase class I)